MHISKRAAFYLAMIWAAGAAVCMGLAAGGIYGSATFAALMSIACAVQFDRE